MGDLQLAFNSQPLSYSTSRRQPSSAELNQEICLPNHVERKGAAVVLCFSAAVILLCSLLSSDPSVKE